MSEIDEARDLLSEFEHELKNYCGLPELGDGLSLLFEIHDEAEELKTKNICLNFYKTHLRKFENKFNEAISSNIQHDATIYIFLSSAIDEFEINKLDKDLEIEQKINDLNEKLKKKLISILTVEERNSLLKTMEENRSKAKQ
jgi:hypothetical protein